MLIAFILGSAMASTSPDFVSLTDLCPEIRLSMDYSTNKNFTGSVVAGYKKKKALMARAPAAALCRIQKKAREQGLTLKIFDCYRPVKAVKFFQHWSQLEETNPEIKKIFYPKYTRKELFEKGYIAQQSSHSRGSAVDLTLTDLKTGADLDMGTAFDYFDELSHTDSPAVTDLQKQNRMMLKTLMESEGFKNFSQEWWHYSLKPEPYPETFFDVDVE